jgi:hypothetical protein
MDLKETNVKNDYAGEASSNLMDRSISASTGKEIPVRKWV